VVRPGRGPAHPTGSAVEGACGSYEHPWFVVYYRRVKPVALNLGKLTHINGKLKVL